jgi:hypothetical protein
MFLEKQAGAHFRGAREQLLNAFAPVLLSDIKKVLFVYFPLEKVFFARAFFCTCFLARVFASAFLRADCLVESSICDATLSPKKTNPSANLFLRRLCDGWSLFLLSEAQLKNAIVNPPPKKK